MQPQPAAVELPEGLSGESVLEICQRAARRFHSKAQNFPNGGDILDDLVSAGCERVLTQISTIKVDENIHGWVYTTATRAMENWLRSERRSRHGLKHDGDIALFERVEIDEMTMNMVVAPDDVEAEVTELLYRPALAESIMRFIGAVPEGALVAIAKRLKGIELSNTERTALRRARLKYGHLILVDGEQQARKY